MSEVQISKYPPVSVKEFIEATCSLDGSKLEVYPFQEVFFSSKSKFRIVNKARQIGFSTAIAMEALYKAVWYPNRVILFVSTGDRASKRLMECFEKLLSSMEKFEMRVEKEDGTKILVTNKSGNIDTNREKSLRNGSRIISLPNNPDNIRGYAATDVYIDEYAFFENPEQVWTAILPSLTRGEGITIVSTPKGRVGHYYEIWDESVRGLNNWERFEFPFTKIKSQLPGKMVENIENLKANMSEIQKGQEYECEFIDENITLFPYELMNPCIVDNTPFAFKHKTANPIFMGVDFGLERNSTIVVFVEQTSEGWTVLEPIKEFKGAKRIEQETGKHVEGDFDPIMQWLENAFRDVRPTRVYVDANGMGERLNNELRKIHGGMIMPVKANNEMKERLILNVRILFENQKIKIPRDDLLINQLHELRKITTEGGTVRYRHGPGKFDDAVWALAYALTPEGQGGMRPMIRGIKRW